MLVLPAVTHAHYSYVAGTATESDMKDLLNELDIMVQVGSHPNIVNLIGACAFGGKSVLAGQRQSLSGHALLAKMNRTDG